MEDQPWVIATGDCQRVALEMLDHPSTMVDDHSWVMTIQYTVYCMLWSIAADTIEGLFVQGLRPWTSDVSRLNQWPMILPLPKHGITTMTLRPLHLGLIYWREEMVMALHSMWIRLQNPKLLLSLEAVVEFWTLLKCSLMGNGKQVLFNAESKTILISSSAIFV